MVQKNSNKSKPDAANIVSLYQQQLQRLQHEGVLYWTRYSALFVIVAGLAAAYAQVSASASPINAWPVHSPFVRACIVVAGTVTSFAWFLSSWSGIFWQDYFNKKVIKFESKYNYLPDLYTTIYHPKCMPDVAAVSATLCIAATLGWLVTAFYEGCTIFSISLLGIPLFFIVAYGVDKCFPGNERGTS